MTVRPGEATSSGRSVPRPEAPSAYAYDAELLPSGTELLVRADIPSDSPAELSVDAEAEPYVRDVRWEKDGHVVSVLPRGSSWFIEGGGRITYRFLLADACRTIADPQVAKEHHGAWLSPPSTWLLHPMAKVERVPWTLRVRTPPHLSFVSGLHYVASRQQFEADIADLPESPYSAFGPLRRLSVALPVPSPTQAAQAPLLEIAILPGPLGVGDGELASWASASGARAGSLYGAAALDRSLLLVLPTSGKGVFFAQTLGNGGGSIMMPMGQATTADDLGEDWVLVHEMLHLAFPALRHRHAWLAEGIATYMEPILRVRTGRLAPSELWRGLMRGLPQGLPKRGDHGLDQTPTWGRTYWGGALFCLLADIEIRHATDNQRSLDDALRGILRAGGDIAHRWELDVTLATADQAVGVPVLARLHERMGNRPEPVDLPALWAKLGIIRNDEGLSFDERAPLAAIRRGIEGGHLPTLSRN